MTCSFKNPPEGNKTYPILPIAKFFIFRYWFVYFRAVWKIIMIFTVQSVCAGLSCDSSTNSELHHTQFCLESSCTNCTKSHLCFLLPLKLLLMILQLTYLCILNRDEKYGWFAQLGRFRSRSWVRLSCRKNGSKVDVVWIHSIRIKKEYWKVSDMLHCVLCVSVENKVHSILFIIQLKYVICWY